MQLGHHDGGRVTQDVAVTFGGPNSIQTASLQGPEDSGALKQTCEHFLRLHISWVPRW